MPPAGPLCSAGVTPLRRSYGPIRQALAFAALRLPARAATLLRGLSPRGEEPFPASTHGLVCMLPSFTPPGDGPRRSRSRASVAFAGFLTARLPDFRLTRPRPDVHSSLRPAHSLTSPGRGFVSGLHRRGLPRRRHPSYAAAIFYRFGTFTLRVHGFLQASQKSTGRPIDFWIRGRPPRDLGIKGCSCAPRRAGSPAFLVAERARRSGATRKGYNRVCPPSSARPALRLDRPGHVPRPRRRGNVVHTMPAVV